MRRTINLVLLFGIIGLAILFFILDPTKNALFPKCTFHSLTGYYCPGCGSQRALHSLLHLDIAGVTHYNFLFIPALLIIIYHYTRPLLNNFFHWKLPNIFYFRQTPWIILAVVVIFSILRNLAPFHFFAPG
ncbi:MAG: hypothetical protein CSA36_04395 [Draconibacterium sp.]|nr:MAG: hypothetical protein CSA36_04395 [Draconibacterium sp.]